MNARYSDCDSRSLRELTTSLKVDTNHDIGSRHFDFEFVDTDSQRN